MTTFVKKSVSFHINCLLYVKVCIDIPEDGLSMDRHMYTFEGTRRLHRIPVVGQHVNTVIIDSFTYLLFLVILM
jgi:hypothetical protein